MQTASGRRLHKRVDAGEDESRDDRIIVRSLAIESARMGLRGKTDVVEFHRMLDCKDGGTAIAGKEGRWMPFPVEYKRGKSKMNNADAVQLCAQAICLEEMLGTTIPEGALFYGKTKRRTPVALTIALRDETERSANALHAMMAEGRTPPPEYQKRKQEEVIHPALEERTTLGLVPHIQAMLFARFIRGDMPIYPAYVVK